MEDKIKTASSKAVNIEAAKATPGKNRVVISNSDGEIISDISNVDMMIAAIHDTAEDGGVHATMVGQCGTMEIARCVDGVLRLIQEIADTTGLGIDGLLALAAAARAISNTKVIASEHE